MSGVLVVAEHRRGELLEVTLELIAAGAELDAAGAGDVTVAVIGADAGTVAERCGADGVDEVLTVAPGERGVRGTCHPGGTRGADRRASRPSSCSATRSTRSASGRRSPPRRARLRATSQRRVGRRAGATRGATAASSSPSWIHRPSGGADAARRRLSGVAPRPTAPPGARRRGRRRGRHRGTSASARPRPATSTSQGRLPALGRPRDRGEESVEQFEELADKIGRNAQRVAAAGRRGLDPERAPGRPVGQDGQAEGVSRARDLRRRPAPGRDPRRRDDHRRQHRSGGADLRGRRTTARWPICSTSPRSSSSRFG